MFEAWEAMIGEEDEVWHLGDLVLASWRWGAVLTERIKRLPGNPKRLIRGNHDYLSSAKFFVDLGFSLYKKPQLLYVNGQRVVLSHTPYTGEIAFDINLHGHIHSNAYPSHMAKLPATILGKYRNLSVEVTDYKPVTLEDAVERRVGGTPWTAGFWAERDDPERVQRRNRQH